MWILTKEYNQYDQEGAYYVKAWCSKPSIAEVFDVLVKDDGPFSLQQVYAGGGRFPDTVDIWYNFFEDKE